MAETSNINSMEQVGSLGDEENGNVSGSEGTLVASLHRKYGLTVPTYSSNQDRAVSSTNKGPYRSVLDFTSTEELTKAMLDTGEDNDTSSFDPFLYQIANGEPVQTVGVQTKNFEGPSCLRPLLGAICCGSHPLAIFYVFRFLVKPKKRLWMHWIGCFLLLIRNAWSLRL